MKNRRVTERLYSRRRTLILDHRPTQLIPVPAEQAVLERITACRAAGLSYRQIAAELTTAGVLTKQGKAAWTHTAVASILKRAAALAA